MKLKAVNLQKSYTKTRKVVNGVSVEVNKGEIVGLLGPNGAGKTTIFNMTVGLLRPNFGKIMLDDEDITGMAMYMRARKGIAYLPQEPSIFRKLTVEQNLLVVLETMAMTDNDRKKILDSTLAEFGLTNLRRQKAYSLSGGEKRRCEISRALLINPQFLLLDEPFVGIDPITVTELQNMIFMLKQRGIGILITDHNVRNTLEVIDRAYIIFEGKILFEGNAKELIDNPDARRVYLGDKFKA
jgi:lipopolysaccharide export system ATP-binding protein